MGIRRIHLALLHSFALLLSTVWLAVSPHALADDKQLQTQPSHPAPIVLEDRSQADAYAAELLTRLREQGIKEVMIDHVGPNVPAGLDALTRVLIKNGIDVTRSRIAPERLLEATARRTQGASEAASEIASLISYGPRAEGRKFRTSFVQRVRSAMAHFFGVPGGISFLTYKVKRGLAEKLTEGGVAVTKATVTSAVLYHTLQAKEAMGYDVNLVLPIIASASFSLFFDYWQRGNSAFKGQGTNYDFESGLPAMNRKFYLLTAFIHSLIVRQTIMASSHVVATGFSMGWADAQAALWTTLIGLFGKAPVEMFIERGRRTHGKWWTIGWMTAWGTFYASLQIFDLFEIGEFMRNALKVFGAMGFSLEIYRSKKAIFSSIQRIVGKITGRYKAERCQTLLTAGKPPEDLPL